MEPSCLSSLLLFVSHALFVAEGWLAQHNNTIILRGRAEYEVIDNQRGAKPLLKTPGSSISSILVFSGLKRLLSAIFFSELQKCFYVALNLARSLTIVGATGT